MTSGKLTWIKSSYSGSQGGNCVAAAADSRGRVLVRDTKDRNGAVLTVPAALWRRFAADVKDGSFPRLSAGNYSSCSSSSSGGVGVERTRLSRGTAANGAVANGGASSSITSPGTVGTRSGPGYPPSAPLSQ